MILALGQISLMKVVIEVKVMVEQAGENCRDGMAVVMMENLLKFFISYDFVDSRDEESP